jgi:pyruvate,water dikinase
MFQISDLASKFHGWSMKLDAALPMDIHLIDLGNGLQEDAVGKWNTVKIDQIVSAPFLALLMACSTRTSMVLTPDQSIFPGCCR